MNLNINFFFNQDIAAISLRFLCLSSGGYILVEKQKLILETFFSSMDWSTAVSFSSRTNPQRRKGFQKRFPNSFPLDRQRVTGLIYFIFYHTLAPKVKELKNLFKEDLYENIFFNFQRLRAARKERARRWKPLEINKKYFRRSSFLQEIHSFIISGAGKH